MSATFIFVAALVTLTIGIIAGLYSVVVDAPLRPQQQTYRRHRPWNFK